MVEMEVAISPLLPYFRLTSQVPPWRQAMVSLSLLLLGIRAALNAKSVSQRHSLRQHSAHDGASSLAAGMRYGLPAVTTPHSVRTGPLTLRMISRLTL